MCVVGGGGAQRPLDSNPGLTIGTDHVIIAERIFSPWVASPLWSQVDSLTIWVRERGASSFMWTKLYALPLSPDITSVRYAVCGQCRASERSAQYSALWACAPLSRLTAKAKRSANVPLTLTGKPNPAQIPLWYKISLVGLIVFFFPRLWWNS